MRLHWSPVHEPSGPSLGFESEVHGPNPEVRGILLAASGVSPRNPPHSFPSLGVIAMVPIDSPRTSFPRILTYNNTGLYGSRNANFLASFFVHVMGLAILLWIATRVPGAAPRLGRDVRRVIAPISFLADE